MRNRATGAEEVVNENSSIQCGKLMEEGISWNISVKHVREMIKELEQL